MNRSVFLLLALFVLSCGGKRNNPSGSAAKLPAAAFLLFNNAMVDVDCETNSYQSTQLKNNGINGYNWYCVRLRNGENSSVTKIAAPDTFTFSKDALSKGKGLDFHMKSDTSAYFILGVRNDTVKQGGCKFLSLPLDSFKVNLPVTFQWDNKKYQLTMAGKRDAVFENKVNVLTTNYALREFRFTLSNEKLKQNLVEDTLYVYGSEFVDVNRIWIGDIDSDNLPDIVSPVLPHRLGAINCMYLSSRAGKDSLVKQVTHLY